MRPLFQSFSWLPLLNDSVSFLWKRCRMWLIPDSSWKWLFSGQLQPSRCSKISFFIDLTLKSAFLIMTGLPSLILFSAQIRTVESKSILLEVTKLSAVLCWLQWFLADAIQYNNTIQLKYDNSPQTQSWMVHFEAGQREILMPDQLEHD